MNLLHLEDERVKTCEIHGEKFTIRAMSPYDRIMIARKRSDLQDGRPVESYTESDFVFFENIAIVDICVEKRPKGYNEYESCMKWPDLTLINDVAYEIRTHTMEFEEKLKKNQPVDGGAEA